MRYRYLRFPGGKTKAVTFSYDDGLQTDVRLCKLLEKYGCKGTFNINSRWLANDESGYNITKEQLHTVILNGGHEVAVHGAQHVAPGNARTIDALVDALECRRELEKMTGRIIRGMAYPDSGITVMNNGASYPRIKHYLTDLDIDYSRSLAADNDRFRLPEDWHNWIPTAHHDNPNILDWAKRFVQMDINSFYAPDRYPRLFYIWGHTYEFERRNTWEHIEELCRMFSACPDVWFATNMEICQYVKAYEALQFNVDNTLAYNPTNQTVWLDSDGKVFEIAPGATVTIG